MTNDHHSSMSILSDAEVTYLNLLKNKFDYLQDRNFVFERFSSSSNTLANYQLSGKDVKIEINHHNFSEFRTVLNLIRRAIYANQNSGDCLPISGFETRGVIEGFYGTPWSETERLEILEFLAFYDFNLFIVAPKDDPWQRFNWRDPLSPSQIAHFENLFLRGQDLGINIAVCVSPGLSIQYSSPDDLAAINNRFRQLASIGITTFGLLLDDIPPKLMNNADKSKFADISNAHAFLINEAYSNLAEVTQEFEFVICPLEYHGRGNEDYLVSLTKKINKEIKVFWTGREICSEYLDSSDARVFMENCNRKPFYWDNYPVNDVAMIHQLHVGPIENREIDLFKYSSGYVANPMDRFESSKFSLMTIGDYLRDPANYVPATSWEFGIRENFSDQSESLALISFLKSCFESCLKTDPAPEFNEWLFNLSFSWHTRDLISVKTLFKSQIKLMSSVINILVSERFSNQRLRVEMAKWLTKYENTLKSLEQILELVAEVSVNPDGSLRAPQYVELEIRKIKEFLANDPTRIFGDGLDMLLGELAAELAVARN